MSILNLLLSLVIGPLKLFFEVLYSLAYRIIGDPGLSIIVLSIVMNFLVLPLYRRADAMQEEERDIEAKLQPWVKHIRKTFHGDERFMMLSMLYKQNNYNPAFALKGSLSLLLEIPFFIAAYQFLSKLTLLQGVSFGPINDLGAPDGLIKAGAITINLLPVLMTSINIVSGAIYTKGLPVKSKIQLYGMALIFLVLLYKSPSGLVFYWTLNNLFSLAKNIFYKLKNPGKILSILASAVGLALILAVTVVFDFPMGARKLLVIMIGVLLQLPVIVRLMPERLRKTGSAGSVPKTYVFVLLMLFLTVLTGLLIPSSVIKASPAEFINILYYKSPTQYVIYTFVIAAGTFLLWMTIFYMLANDGTKRVFLYAAAAAAVGAAVDYFAFGNDLGNISSILVYDAGLSYGTKVQLVNIAVLVVVAVVCALVVRYKQSLVPYAALVGIIAIAALGIMNLRTIAAEAKTVRDNISDSSLEVPEIKLTKDGKNVIVLMLDRGISNFVPYLMAEKPELQEQFKGFTFYPNTTSFGPFTNFGTPGLFGGYEYTPKHMNERTDQTIAEKHNEAIRVLPYLFDDNGFAVTVCDPIYAGYNWVPDLSVFNDHPEIRAFIADGKFDPYSERSYQMTDDLRMRNFFCYSLVRICPLVLQPYLYNSGVYNSTGTTYNSDDSDEFSRPQVIHGLTTSDGVEQTFMDAYGVLANLSAITQVVEEPAGTFTMMTNDTTHEPMMLQEPAYEPAEHVDNSAFEADPPTRVEGDDNRLVINTADQMTHYQINMAAFIKLGEWFEYLRENDVWDNTRIVIVSDHGRDLGLCEDMILDDGVDTMILQALLMVKDFDSEEFTVDEQFMTNADVPQLLTDDVIQDPVNPFTGKLISSVEKESGPVEVIYSSEWDIETNNGTAFLPAYWYSVHDDIFNKDNWTYLGEY